MSIRNDFEQYLENKVTMSASGITKDAMHYSLMNGGKRVRPQLLFDTLKGYGINEEIGFPAACALEMIHTYSLIHDDLPAMDDDQLRRGNPTCHIQYNEATAILAGDALLTLAFEILCESEVDPKVIVDMVCYTSQYAGIEGMIYGQELDIAGEEAKELPIEEIEAIDYFKTGKLLTLPFIYAALLASREQDIDTWMEIGSSIGLQFQIMDDILDVTQSQEKLGKSTSDIDNAKSTYVSVLGLEKAKERVKQLEQEIMSSLETLDLDVQYIKQTLSFLSSREY